MRRFIAFALALIMIFALCACGKQEEEVKERDCGVYVTVEADDVRTVSYGTEEGSSSCEHADGSVLDVGEVVHFDFAGDAALGSEKAVIDYSICVYDKDLNILAIESFSSDFANMARIDITITADHRILNASDKLVCGGDTIVDIKTKNPVKSVNIAVATVTMPNRPDAADAINANIKSLNDNFKGKQLESYKKTYNSNKAELEKDSDAKISKFSMTRYVEITRGDSAILCMRMCDLVDLGTEAKLTITGHNFNASTGAELKLSDIATDPTKLVSTCSEDILVSTTEDEMYKDVLFNEGYTDTVKDLISDGHWYLGAEGLIVSVNPGEIASAELGSFDFTVKYDTLTGLIKDEFLPAEFSGDSGDITAQLAEGADTSALTIVGKEASADVKSVLVSVTGKIYNVSVYSIKYKSASSYTVNAPLWYCSDLAEGAAFAINKALTEKPNILVSFNRPDGTYEHRLLSIGSDGSVKVTDPDGGEQGTVITDRLPYSVDLNSDETQETVSTQSGDDGFVALKIESAGESFTEKTLIKSDASVRLFDINGDKLREIYIDGKDKNGSKLTYCFSFDGELKALNFGDKSYASGAFQEFVDGKLYIKQTVNVLGTYSAQVIYKLADGAFAKASADVKLMDTSYVKTAKEVPLADGTILPADYKIKFLETDLSSYISFTSNKGLKGKIAIEKADSGWTIAGSKDTSYFESLPYKK